MPTSLTYIILSTRGCSPWRPAADMGTIWHENHIRLPRIFKGQRERTGHRRNRGALREQRPYLRLNRFQGVRPLKRKENSSRDSRRRLRVRLRYRARTPRRSQSPCPGSGILTRFPFDRCEHAELYYVNDDDCSLQNGVRLSLRID